MSDNDVPDIAILLNNPFEGPNIDARLTLTRGGFVLWEAAFGPYDKNLTRHASPNHEMVSAETFMTQLFKRGKCGKFYRTTTAFHPTFVEPMLKRFGVEGSSLNTVAIRFANALSRGVDACIARQILCRAPLPHHETNAWGPALYPIWDMYNVGLISKHLGDHFRDFEQDYLLDGDAVPRCLQPTEDYTLGALGTHVYVSDAMQRTSDLMRSHPTLAPEGEGKTLSSVGNSSTSMDVIVRPEKSSPDLVVIPERIGADGSPSLLIERDTGMIYISTFVRAYKKKAADIINGLEMQRYIATIQDHYGLERHQVCDKRLSPDGNSDGFYVHFLLALELMAKCDPCIRVKFSDIVMRYLCGEVTTEESRNVARALARSVGVLEKDGSIGRVTDPIEIAGVKRKMTMELRDQVRDKNWAIEQSRELRRSYERLWGESRKTNASLRDENTRLRNENAKLCEQLAALRRS